MLGIIISAMCASHVPVTRLQNSAGTQDTLVVSAMVRGVVDTKETVYLSFGDGDSYVAGRMCEAGADDDGNVPVYYERRAYWVPCLKQAESSVVTFGAFNPGSVTLTDSAIEFCTPVQAGAKRLISASRCTDLLECVFESVTDAGDPVMFKVNPSARQHRLHENMTGTITRFGRGDTPITLDARLYNTYERADDDEPVTVAIGYTNTFVHFNGTDFSIWTIEDVDSVSNLFTMALMLLGAIMFVPTSVDITDCLYMDEDGVKAAVTLIGSPKHLMHAVLMDFSTSAACVAVYLSYSNGVGNGTFKSSASEELTTLGDAIITFYTVLCSAGVVWCVFRCHLEETHDPVHSHKLRRFRTFLGYSDKPPPPPSVVHVVVARIGFEYSVVVAFMASCPMRMGSGFVQCVYLVASAVLLIAIGRDANILCRDAAASNRQTLLIVVIAVTAAYPLSLYGIKPLVEAARSFSSTAAVTWSVTVAITVTFLCAGASSLKGRLRLSLVPNDDACTDQ